MDQLLFWLDDLLIVILALPVVAAAAVLLVGRTGAGVRRTAAYFAAAQLLLTVGLVMLAGMALGQHGRNVSGTFKPIGVPGAPSDTRGWDVAVETGGSCWPSGTRRPRRRTSTSSSGWTG
jgi:hypothetical protein